MRHWLLFLVLAIGLANCTGSPRQAVETSTNGTPNTGLADLVGSYRLTYHPDSTDAATRLEDYTLVLGKASSKFQSPSARARDSLTEVGMSLLHKPNSTEAMQLVTGQLYSLPRAMHRFIIYKTWATGQLTYYDWVGTTLYHYEEPVDLFHWTLMPGRATIAGYPCQRASTSLGGRTWEAWFTRTIPVSDGPYKFHGLPGLIVQVADTHQQYQFDLLKLTKLISPVAITPPSLAHQVAKPTTKAELLRGQLAYTSSMADRIGSMGNVVSAADRQRMQRYNPIELR